MLITKEMRDAIVRDALAFKFKPAEEAHKAARTALADSLYAHEFGPVEAQARAMPSGWVGYSSRIDIQSTGFSYNCADPRTREPKPDVQNYHLDMSQDRPQPAAISTTVTVGEKHPCWEQAQALVKNWRQLHKAKAELKEKIVALLNSCTTVEQLRKAWPEGERFFPQGAKKSYAVVPVGLSDQINKALGLPSKADSATQAVRAAASS